ncbi:AbrB/MazE/SpoVT family DNA-binding domain-containing protein [bacterium]|nr:AbrB/MazE/SpoVT family DNA-binding domain-containing protein [bacterium]
MLTEFRQKSQITIPKDIVNKIGLSEGDKIDISEKNGVIYIIPVSVYPKSYVEELKKEVYGIREKIASGKQPVFDDLDALFEKLDKRK